MNHKTVLVEKLPWDSRFFGFNIARLNSPILTRSLVDSAFEFCQDHQIRSLYYRAATNDSRSVELAEKYGFHFANFRVTYGFDFDLGHTFPQIPKNPFIFRASKPSDLAQLQAISKNLFLDSRYYYDPNFPRRLCDKLYSTWIRKLAGKSKKNQGVAVLSDGKKIAGYIGYEFADGTVNLVLVGVSRHYQGRGVGKILLGQFLKKMFKDGFSKFEVVTQGRNIASQRLYQSGGFKIFETHMDYHRWF